MILIAGEVQKTILASLLANTAFAASVTNRVYDHVPQLTSYPFARIEITSDSDPRKGAGAETLEVTLHIWSQHHGSKEAKDIAVLAVAALEHTPSAASNSNALCYHLAYKNYLTSVASDGVTRHSVVRFTALAQPRS